MWRLAAAAALLLPAMPAAAQRPAEAGRVERLALDLERSEAIRAIKRLQVAQAQLLLYGLWDEAAGLYARDAQVATGDRTVRGRAGIRAWLIDRFGYGEAAPAAKALRLQLMLAPVVTLAADGSSARGRWSELATTGVYGGRADWFGGMQENVYVREDGVWKIGRVAVFAQFAGSYAEGWRSPTPDLPVIPYHFVPSMAGRPVPDIPGGTERPAADTPAQLAALLAGTERRIAALNDEDAVRNLQGAYGYYVDRKMWDDAADLFAADARFEIAGVGGWRGPRGIRRALELDGPAPLSMGQVNDRLQLHLVVTVLPGGQARARGLQLGMITPRLGEAWWELASFENRYVKGADGKWRIAELRVFPVVKSDYYQGWARNWLPPAGPPRAQYPDTRARPGSAPAVPPFSYLHPVTGKPIAGGAAAEVAAEAPTPSGSIADRLDAAALALDRARAWDAIENISSALGYYLDDFQWDAFADTLSADGWKPRAGGWYVGRDHVYRAMAQAYMAGPSPTMARDTIRAHLRTQPVILVSDDARTAKVRTRMLLYTIGSKEAGSFASGIYPNEMAVLEQGVWKFSVGGQIDEKYFESRSWKQGWARPLGDGLPGSGTVLATPPALADRLGNPVDFPPDVSGATMPARLRGFARGSPVWPQIKPMWFAYPNPVSGRIPEYYCPDLRTCEPMAAAAEAKRSATP